MLNNVAFGLKLRGKKNAREEAESLLNRLGLMNLAKEHASTLSYGEAQRVALARALVLQSEVLFLDEPTANLDPYNVGLIEDMLETVNRERNTTVVLVTHNVFPSEAGGAIEWCCFWRARWWRRDPRKRCSPVRATRERRPLSGGRWCTRAPPRLLTRSSLDTVMASPRWSARRSR